jgi:hypothetical protein
MLVIKTFTFTFPWDRLCHAMSATGKKGSKKDGVGGGLVCAHCKKMGELGTMKRCGRCRLACYCSVECQKLHWKGGGHKKVCGKVGGSGASNDGAGASGEGDTPLQHPCPICLDNEDDAGDQGMCYSCGQLFCGSCRDSLNARSVIHCPTCRAVLRVPDKERVRLLRQLVARSDGRHILHAQYDLGQCYKTGVGVTQDSSEAMGWYRLAADQGDASAQDNLGTCYENGAGVAQDSGEAARWYRLAAEQGHANSQYNLGLSYCLGNGVLQDSAEAARWFHLAADQGHEGALAVVAQLGM